MIKQIIMIFVALVFAPLIAFSDCYESYHDTGYGTPEICDVHCEDNVCYYYDHNGNCWEYDNEYGYYPCGCACDECNDNCNDCYYCHHGHYYDHDCDDYWYDCTCFIGAINCLK